MQSIFSYVNYRAFLNDFYEYKKKDNPRFSYRVFGRLAGFSSPNFLKLVILGQRNLSADGIVKVIKALKLEEKEAHFFTALVLFNQSDLHADKKKYYEQLTYFKEFNVIKKIEGQLCEYLSHWHHAAIRELTLLPSFREDPNWIVRKLGRKISIEDTLESLKLLQNMKLLERDAKGKLRPVDKNLSTEPEIDDFSATEFHHQMIALAGKSLDESLSEFRDISSVTVAVDYPTFLEAKKRIQDFRRNLNVLLSSCKKPDAVYQLNFQIFNLTEPPWKINR